MTTLTDSPVSVIVPAHDESATIERGLRAMTEGARPGELDVIVVCNGCSDDTAERARRLGGDVRVLETPIASKSHALNLGESTARSFPRFFVDADVILPLASIRAVAAVLRSGEALAAAPRLEVDLTGCPWSVRAFYDVWLRLPYVNEGMLGCGVYALSEAGRTRFGAFPSIIADDDFTRVHFAPHERKSVRSASFTMIPPRSLDRLIHINLRRIAGDRELRATVPAELIERSAVGHGGALLRLARNPALWPSLAVYVYAKLAAEWRYLLNRRRGTHKRWARDETSRRTPGA